MASVPSSIVIADVSATGKSFYFSDLKTPVIIPAFSRVETLVGDNTAEDIQSSTQIKAAFDAGEIIILVDGVSIIRYPFVGLASDQSTIAEKKSVEKEKIKFAQSVSAPQTNATGVVPGTYANPIVTVGTDGRIISISNGEFPRPFPGAGLASDLEVGLTKLSLPAANPLNPIAVGDNDLGIIAARAATSSDTFGSIVKRDGAGSFSVTSISASAAPVAVSDLTRKDYVDSLVAGRVIFQGVKDMSSDPGMPAPSSGNKGWYYRVSVASAGDVSYSNLPVNHSYNVGDELISDGLSATWDVIDGVNEDVSPTPGTLVLRSSTGGGNFLSPLNVTNFNGVDDNLITLHDDADVLKTTFNLRGALTLDKVTNPFSLDQAIRIDMDPTQSGQVGLKVYNNDLNFGVGVFVSATGAGGLGGIFSSDLGPALNVSTNETGVYDVASISHGIYTAGAGNVLRIQRAFGVADPHSGDLINVSDFTGGVAVRTGKFINYSDDVGGAFAIELTGTVSAGVWHGTKISEVYGGTNQSSYILGDTLYSSAANTLSKLAGNITAVKQFLSQTGTGAVSAAPVWATLVSTDISDASSDPVASKIAIRNGSGGAGFSSVWGSTASGGTLTLQSTSHATKGKILFGTSAYDEVNNRLGIANSTPAQALDVTGAGLISTFLNAGTYFRVGSTSAPSNTTTGDVNAVRAYFGSDASILSGLTAQVAGALGVSAQNAIRLYNTGNTFYVGHRGDASRSANITYTWPVTDPTAGQILTSGAPSGNISVLSWTSASALSGVDVNATVSTILLRTSTGGGNFRDTVTVKMTAAATTDLLNLTDSSNNSLVKSTYQGQLQLNPVAGVDGIQSLISTLGGTNISVTNQSSTVSSKGIYVDHQGSQGTAVYTKSLFKNFYADVQGGRGYEALVAASPTGGYGVYSATSDHFGSTAFFQQTIAASLTSAAHAVEIRWNKGGAGTANGDLLRLTESGASAPTFGGKVLRFNNGSDVFSFDRSGGLALTGAITGATGYNGLVITADTGVVTTGVWNAGAVTTSGLLTLTPGTLTSGVANGAGAIGLLLNTPSYTTSGAKLQSWQNASTEKAFVDKDGGSTFTGKVTVVKSGFASDAGGILTDTDPDNGAVRSVWIVPPVTNSNIYVGTATVGLYTLDFRYCSGGIANLNKIIIGTAPGGTSVGSFTMATATGTIGGFGANGTPLLVAFAWDGTNSRIFGSAFGPLSIETQSNYNLLLSPNGSGIVVASSKVKSSAGELVSFLTAQIFS